MTKRKDPSELLPRYKFSEEDCRRGGEITGRKKALPERQEFFKECGRRRRAKVS